MLYLLGQKTGENAMEKRFAIFLDIDDTIFDGEKVQKEDLDAIKEAREKGHYVFINTGRTWGIMPDIIKEIEVDGYVFGLGTEVKVGDKVLRSVILPEEMIEKHIKHSLKYNLGMLIQCDDTGIWVKEKSDEHSVNSYEDYKKRFPNKRVGKFYFPGQIPKEAKEELENDFNFYEYENYAEAAPKGYSKARGMKIIENYLGVDHKYTMAIGDSMNDYSMIEYAEYGIVMGGGDMKLLEVTSKMTKSVKEAGVAKAIRKYVLCEE